MAGLREEITKTLLRLTRGPTAQHSGVPASNESESPTISNHEGRRLGPYNIIRKLGTGGMGHVYLAFDTRLGRHVALKFLSPDLLSDPDMLNRLQSEARAASSLNHPNILTIHEVAEIDGEHFISCEYVEGATLRVALERDAVSVSAALDIATQVASALVAAHAAGIVHRDLKPGNIMIREDGYVKVIDFGLAKRLGRPTRKGRAVDLTLTRPGTVVGTVHYMSPEQANGSTVDGRADIWSLGVILYELVTHRLPFDGATEEQVLDRIRDQPVPELPHTLPLPPGLGDVIRRALSKEPATRFQNARELLSALGAIHRPGNQTTPRPISLRPTRNRRRLRWISIVLAASVMFLALWQFALRDLLFRPDWFQFEKVRQVTMNGQVILSCISPDGRYLAYAAGDPHGLQTLYLSQLNTATEQIKIPAREINYLGLRFSPDNQLYVVSEGPDLLGKLYVVPLVGDAPDKPLLVDIDGPVTFSPKGDRFAFVRYTPIRQQGRDQTESAIYTCSLDGSHLHKLTSTTESQIIHQLAWSPRSDTIAAIYFSDRVTLHLITRSNQTIVRNLPDWQVAGQPWWSDDGRSIILSVATKTESGSHAQLRQIDVQTGQIHDITNDLAGYQSTSLAENGLALAAVKIEARANLWISASNDFSHGRTLLAEAVKYPSLSWQDDGHLIFNSQRTGYPNVWLLETANLTHSHLTNGNYVDQDAIPIPRTRSIVLSSNRSGQFKLWRFDSDTNSYRQLTFGPNYDQSPTISPNGQTLIYTSWSKSTPHLRSQGLDSGIDVKFGQSEAQTAQFSPDGKTVAALLHGPDENWTVTLLDATHPDSAKPLPRASYPLQWEPDSSAVDSIVTDRRGVSNVWSIPLNGGSLHQITRFDDGQIAKFAWSPAGTQLACLRISLGSDVNLFTRVR